jgi:hypothetical protein
MVILRARPTRPCSPVGPMPATVTVNDCSSMELGVQLKTATVSAITGIRFYKGSQEHGHRPWGSGECNDLKSFRNTRSVSIWPTPATSRKRFPYCPFGELTKYCLTSVNRGRYSALARRNCLRPFIVALKQRQQQLKIAEQSGLFGKTGNRPRAVARLSADVL